MLTNGSDSSGEGKVVANSVDGEEGLVDITMKDSNNDDKVDHDVLTKRKSGDKPL